jgi:HEAT repeat protein
MERGRAASLVAMVGAVLVSAQCLSCGLLPRSEDRLLAVAQSGATSAHRRDALLQLRGRLDSRMRQDLEAVLARDVDPANRAVAAQMLAELGDPAAAAALKTSLRRDVSALVRRRSLAALAGLLGPQAAEDLRHAVADDPAPEVRALAAELAPEQLSREEAVAFLLDALNDSSTLVKVKAQGALHELTDVSAPPDRQSWNKALGRE